MALVHEGVNAIAKQKRVHHPAKVPAGRSRMQAMGQSTRARSRSLGSQSAHTHIVLHPAEDHCRQASVKA